jgi:prepilin signal peptidase PulO-like enzyme (type II secretory pathway)
LTLIALKKSNQAGRLAFVPYLAFGAVVWIFGGVRLWYELYGPLLSPR